MVGRELPGAGLEHGLEAALSSVPRVRCPHVAIDAILERGQVQRRRAAVRGVLSGVLFAAVVAGAWVLGPEPKAPVHLKIQLIEAPAVEPVQVGGRTVGEWDLLVDGVPGEVEAP